MQVSAGGKQVSQLHTPEECFAWMLEWWGLRGQTFQAHALKAQAPITGLEPGAWPQRMEELADAYGWAMMNQPKANECYEQAIACSTGSVARAEVKCNSLKSIAKQLEALAKTADRKSSILQSLNRQR